MTFNEIFTEYYTLYRGQASKIPAFGDREYSTGIVLANAAIKKWERADGILWKELWTTLAADGAQTVTAGTTDYEAPTNMMTPPGQLTINGSAYQVVPTQDVALYGDSGRVAWFTGDPHIGYTLHLPLGSANQAAGQVIDYAYYKKATLLTLTKNPGNIQPEMSDPTFLIQDMLATRAQQARNGFVFKAAKAESTAALANMKIRNDSGTYHNMTSRVGTSGWGKSQYGSVTDIRL